VIPETGLDLSRALLAFAFVAVGLVGIGLITRVRPSGGRLAS
jgi:hypothetical protein